MTPQQFTVLHDLNAALRAAEEQGVLDLIEDHASPPLAVTLFCNAVHELLKTRRR